MRTIVIFVFAGLLIGSILGQCMIFAFCGAGVGLAFGAGLAVALSDVVPLREVARGPVVLVAMRSYWSLCADRTVLPGHSYWGLELSVVAAHTIF